MESVTAKETANNLGNKFGIAEFARSRLVRIAGSKGNMTANWFIKANYSSRKGTEKANYLESMETLFMRESS
jgi:hypothetical protein